MMSKYLSTRNYSSKRFYFKTPQIPFAKQVTCPPFMLGNCIPCTDGATSSKIHTYTLSLLPQEKLPKQPFNHSLGLEDLLSILHLDMPSLVPEIYVLKRQVIHTLNILQGNYGKKITIFHTDKRNRSYL